MLQRLRRAARLFAAGLRHPLTLLVFYFGMLWAFEWTFRAWEIPDFRGPGLWVSFVFCIPAALLLWILSTSLPRRANRVIAWVLVLGIAVLFGSQMVYHRIFYTYYTGQWRSGAGVYQRDSLYHAPQLGSAAHAAHSTYFVDSAADRAVL